MNKTSNVANKTIQATKRKEVTVESSSDESSSEDEKQQVTAQKSE